MVVNAINRAVIVTSDGDFGCLVEYLYEKEKLLTVLSPRSATCSILLKRTARERIAFLDTAKGKLRARTKLHPD